MAVSTTGSGREALAALEKEYCALVLMDVQMPESDSRKRRIAGAHIPILAMTANALKGDAERCPAGGLDGYISKPIRTNELIAAIESFLDGAPLSRIASKLRKQLTR